MEMQKQKPSRKKNKIITKSKVLSATMSGTLLMTLDCQQKTVQKK